MSAVKLQWTVPGAPACVHHCRFGNFRCRTESQRLARDAAWSFGSTLALIGPPGVGKSHLAYARALKWLNQFASHRVFWIDQKSWYARIKGNYDTHTDDILTHTRQIDYLVFDELDTPTGDDEMRNLRHLIQHRMDRLKHTMITSNVGVDMFRKIVGDRITSRFRSAENRIIVVDGEDQRK